MKKVLAFILMFVFILPFCGSAFAANEDLTMSFKSEREDGVIVNTFQYRDAEGRLIREETDRIGDRGQLLGKEIDIYNTEGQRISNRKAGYEDNGAWKDDEAVWTYNSDGSLVMDTRIVVTYPDQTRQYRFEQTVIDAEGKAAGRGESRSATGEKLYDYSFSYKKVDGERIDTVKYMYPGGEVSTERTRYLEDGTRILETELKDADGKVTKTTFWQEDPDGTYHNTSTVYTTLNDGKERVSTKVESLNKDGVMIKEEYSCIQDEDGIGSGRGVFTQSDGRHGTIDLDYREDDEEGYVTTVVYRHSDGRIDLRYEVEAPDGKVTKTFEEDVRNYDGGDDDENEDEELDADIEALLEEDEDQAEDPFDEWDEAFNDWEGFQYEGVDYIGDMTGFDDSDVEIDYYDTDVEWDEVTDWGDESDWSPDGDEYSEEAVWDIASGWDDASGWE